MVKIKRGSGLLVALRSTHTWCGACGSSGDGAYNGHYYPVCGTCGGKGFHRKGEQA